VPSFAKREDEFKALSTINATVEPEPRESGDLCLVRREPPPNRKKGAKEVTVATNDVGSIIAKQGRSARAIRELLNVIAAARKTGYELDIVDTTSLWPLPPGLSSHLS
jgi:predicted RNA-binding protein YlqC (UPF0109 family)